MMRKTKEKVSFVKKIYIRTHVKLLRINKKVFNSFSISFSSLDGIRSVFFNLKYDFDICHGAPHDVLSVDVRRHDTFYVELI